MGRLFWKVFLGFWLTTVIIVVVTSVTLSTLVERSEPGRFRARQEARLEASAATAQILVEQNGVPAVRDWLREQNTRFDNPLLLLDENGRDVLGRRVPPQLRRNTRDRPILGRRDILDAVITAADGRTFRLVAPPSPNPPGARRPGLGILVVGLPIAVVISGLICWMLARYLARPIRHLQTATRRLAAGDLDVRVGPAIGGRRDEIADLGGDFDHMAERLKQLLTAQQQLLRDVSHELRTPLARLHVALGLARQRNTGIDAELDRIELEGKRLDELIDELLTVMRLRTGGQPVGDDTVDLRALVESVAADAKLEAESQNRRVVVVESISATVRGNMELLRRALENIVRNGIRHTDENTPVELRLTADGSALIEISDHGPGVPENDLARLFDPFFRAEAARDRESGGHGLGLAIAQQAVRLHGGEISARNGPAGGLIVRISLPSSRAN